MADRIDLSTVRRSEFVRRSEPIPGDPSVSGGGAQVPRGWHWYALPYANERSALRAADRFVEVGDVLLLGNGTIVLGGMSFRHGQRIDRYSYLGMTVTRKAGWGRILQIDTPSTVYRFVFSLDNWYVLVPAKRWLPRFAFRAWLVPRMVWGLGRRMLGGTVQTVRGAFSLAIILTIAFLTYKAIIACWNSGFSIFR